MQSSLLWASSDDLGSRNMAALHQRRVGGRPYGQYFYPRRMDHFIRFITFHKTAGRFILFSLSHLWNHFGPFIVSYLICFFHRLKAEKKISSVVKIVISISPSLIAWSRISWLVSSCPSASVVTSDFFLDLSLPCWGNDQPEHCPNCSTCESLCSFWPKPHDRGVKTHSPNSKESRIRKTSKEFYFPHWKCPFA